MDVLLILEDAAVALTKQIKGDKKPLIEVPKGPILKVM